MSYASDDLTPLLAPPAGGARQAVGFRQGTVIAFDPITLANTVQVGGAEFTNLPLLGIAEAVTLTPGDVVGIMAVTSTGGAATFAIMGQYVTPSSPEAAGAISVPSVNTYSASVATFETRGTATWGNLTTVGPVVADVRIGPSGRCLVYITSAIILLTTSGGGEMAYEISGATTVPTGDTPPALTYYGPVGSGPCSTRLVLQEGLNPGLHTFTAKYLAEPDSAGGLARFGGRNLTVMAL